MARYLGPTCKFSRHNGCGLCSQPHLALRRVAAIARIGVVWKRSQMRQDP